MLSEKFTFCFKITIKWNITKSHATRLKSAKLFLDVNIFHENDKFATNVYRKKTFNGVYTNFKSFITETYNV